MANVKISDLTGAASASGTQEFEVNDSGTSKKVTGSQLATFIEGEVSSSPTLTGQVSLDNGTNTAPSLTNTGDTNTGLYFPSDDTVGLAAGGGLKLSANASGIDVTGTVTADGLTVDGNILDNAGFKVKGYYSNDAGDGYNVNLGVTGNTGYLQSLNGLSLNALSLDASTLAVRTGSSFSNRLNIGSNGDLSLYDSTGTTPKFFWDASAERLGIGTSSPSSDLHIVDDVTTLSLESSSSNGQKWNILSTYTNTGGSYGAFIIEDEAGSDWLRFDEGNGSPFSQFLVNGSEAMRIDSSGNLLVGATTITNLIGGTGNDGVALTPNHIEVGRSGGAGLFVNRYTSDGDIAEFRKDGTTVGSIGTHGSGRSFIAMGTNASRGWSSDNSVLYPCDGTGAGLDNTVDLGRADIRFDDIFATNGTIQTSDRNEKQDIEALSDAEQRVAVACKGLLRKFRWKDAVAEKGDDARIHFGIIAQDLQDAFAAEGLDAGRYAMFISSTWTDEETGEERTRMGVRYPELLAFIIAAI